MRVQVRLIRGPSCGLGIIHVGNYAMERPGFRGLNC